MLPSFGDEPIDDESTMLVVGLEGPIPKVLMPISLLISLSNLDLSINCVAILYNLAIALLCR